MSLSAPLSCPIGAKTRRDSMFISEPDGGLNALNSKIATTSVRVLDQVDPGSTETEYTLANGAKLSDYKMLYVTRSWYSSFHQGLCIPANCLQYAPFVVQIGNDYVKVSYSSDTKVKVEASTANMRCSAWLTK